ncbi:MAG: glycosyltransferase family 39 protein [Phycisphaerae bacterium]|nr:glycosyltransferase family 39 protein [Phycisphaerae bacterium]
METDRSFRARVFCDLLLIAVLSLTAQAAHFTWKQGRVLVSADSLQYRDNAEALLAGDRAPDFAFRKPGYSLVLAASLAVFGSMSWGVAVLQYLMLAILPLGAYGFGRLLHSRGVGWLAAILTTARLFEFIWAERVMSETTYAVLLTFGLLAVAAAMVGEGHARRAWVGGMLLGFAWLVRSVAVVPIAAAAIVLPIVFRRKPREACVAVTALLIPFGASILVESLANWRHSDHFGPCTGTRGGALILRATYLQGLSLPDTPEGRTLVELLPERSAESAYRANKLDTWVGRYRAIHDHGMSEWGFDDLASTAAQQLIHEHPLRTVRLATEIFVRHLLRRTDGVQLAVALKGDEAPMIAPAGAADDPAWPDNWYAYWALPNRTPQQAMALSERMRSESQTKAPFGSDGLWQHLRYWSRTSPISDTISALANVGLIWPGFALLLAVILGLNRRTCALLATAYLLEALVYAVFGATDASLERFQSVWVAVDTALAAALFAPIVQSLELYRARWSMPGQVLPASRLRPEGWA